MTLTIPIKAIQLTPGSAITINNLTWQDFETILNELGKQRRVRLSYYQGNLEIVSPLAIHERPHRIIADIVKTILDVQKQPLTFTPLLVFRKFGFIANNSLKFTSLMIPVSKKHQSVQYYLIYL